MKYSLNLASGTYVNQRHLYVIFLLFGLFLFGLLFVNGLSLFRESNRIVQLDLRLEELRGRDRGKNQEGEINSAALAQLAQRINAANEILVRDDYRWTELLDQLESHLAAGISISGLQPDYKSGVLKLNGVAGSVADLKTFIDNLSRSEVFSDVFLRQQRTEKTNDDFYSGVSFQIEMRKRSGDDS